MAVKKKKAARKKARSAAKKKTTRSAAKKKTARRAKGTSRKPKAGRRPKTHRFKYFCRSNTCGVVPVSKHMSTGDKVILTATGTNATILFTSGSPFLSGVTTINLTSGVPQTETIGGPFAPTPRHFPYTIHCSACQSTVVLPPEMIVP